MKLKEINHTAMPSWSPAQHHPIYLATGTSAQQLDASFSTNASLNLFELDLADPSLDMKPCGSFSSTHRYHKLVWGPYGIDGQSHPSGVLIAGGENGNIILYDPAKIMAGASDVVITESDLHTGPVRALDINPFQTNLVASGANESEIYIWDMNTFRSPMTPGPKTQPLEDISCVAWNRQVQHILASASPSGRASVWDLRKNDLIIKVSDHSNRMHCSGMAWNPDIATQLAVASEDDRMPVIQMWDLRFATSPLKVLENHTRGVLAIAWSLADPELLLSCGKDSRILCWNPNTGEVLYELPTSSQWCFDIQWCPRNPAVLSAAGFDGYINIYSIMGGTNQAQSQRHADQISNSFGNMDPFGTGQTLPPLQLPQTTALPTTVNPLKKPPKWICRPVGASFAFGGKLVSLENTKPNPQQPQQPMSYFVHVSQVVTETALLKRSNQLQATLSSGRFVEFCQDKIDAAGNEFEKTVWSFLKANFDSDTRSKFLELLGYNKEELALKISAALDEKPAEMDYLALANTHHVADLSLALPADASEAAFDLIAAANLLPTATTLELDTTSKPERKETLEEDAEEKIAVVDDLIDEKGEQDLTAEQKEEDEEIPLEELQEITAPTEEEPSPADISAPCEEAPQAPSKEAPQAPSEEVPQAPSEEVPQALSEEAPQVVTPPDSVSLSINVDGLITQALLTGDFEGAVELCLHDNRMADSIILAIAGGGELLEKTQRKYFTKSHSKITKLISAVVMKEWHDILNTCELQNWKEALAAVMTYAQPQEFSSLCDLLGGRLETANDAQLQAQACLCYICAGNVEKLVSCWTKSQEGSSPLSLQDLVEKVVVMRYAVEQTQSSGPTAIGALLAEKMRQYANLLASQGSLSIAITYLPDNTNQVCLQQLHERLSHALGKQAAVPLKPQRALSQVPNPQTQHVSAQSDRPYTPLQPTTAAPAPVAAPTSAPAPPQYYQPVRAASTVTSWSNQTPTAFPHVPTPLPVGTISDQPKVEPSNSMYGMPVTGTAAGPPASSTSAYMYSHQYQPYPQVNQYPQAAGGAPVYQPLQHSSSAAPPPAEHSFPPHPAGFLSQYCQPDASQTVPSLYPTQPPPFFPTASSTCPLPPSLVASFQHGGPGSPGSCMQLPPQSGVSGPQNGWNDPPALNRAPKKKQVPGSYNAPAPITAPIMAPLGVDPQAQPMSSGASQIMGQSPQAVQAHYSGIHQQPLAPSAINPAMPKASAEGAPGAPTGDVIQAMPAEKITKKPIPDEHLVLKTTFEGLIQKCLAVATDPQTKRKLDDANKRMEALYDKLREETLSPAIVGGLHNIARTIESRSYAEGLNIHTHIVSSCNFSETSAFMPVLKVVLTQANKLGV